MTTRFRLLRHTLRRQRGFTLVEAVVVMVVTGILAGTMVLFIRRPVQNYTDAAARADLSDAADLALRRMARELRGALPNSVRLTVNNGVWWLEFIPTIAGGQYLAVENGAPTGSPLSFTNAVATTFNVVGPMPKPLPTFSPTGLNNYLVIYNLGVGFLGADAYARSNLARITGVNNTAISYERYLDGDAAGNGINPFAGQTNPNSSPGQRFQVVTEPVTFRCQGLANGKGTLTRSVAANFLAAQPTPTAAAGALLANNVVACNFSIGTAATQQSALIGLSIALGRPDINGGNAVETVTLTHQIHVDNTP
jgi:MSHA biogenesis protein MshO